MQAVTNVPIDKLVIDDQRTELGDLAGLAESIRNLGVILPIVIDRDMRVIAGRRRVAAARLASFQTVPCIVRAVADPVDSLRVTKDENEFRKCLTVAEKVALLRKIKDGHARANAAGGPQVRPFDAAAADVGLSRTTAARAQAVVRAAESEPALAPIVQKMSETGNVTAAYEEVKEATGKSAKSSKAEKDSGEQADAVGNPIEDDSLAAAFTIGQQLVEAVRDLKKMKNWIVDVLEELEIEGVAQQLSQMEAQFKNITNLLECYTPHVIVPSDAGMDPAIMKRGWINKRTYEALTPKQRESFRRVP